MSTMYSTSFLLFTLFVLRICHSSVPEENAPKEGKVIHEEILEEVPYITPKPTGNYFLAETFDDVEEYQKRWITSQAKKDDTSEEIAKYNGEWAVEAPESETKKEDLGLVLKSKAKHHAISAKLNRPYIFTGKPFVLQYEVRFQNGQECGGAYLKLLTEDPSLQLANFHDKVPYTIMFGPDKCGTDSKLHFIFRHKNPKNGSIEEKHWKKTSNVAKLDEIFSDKKPHLFSLILTPDDQFEVKVDYQVVQRGNLLQDFEPPVNPPAEIDDPEDFKPKDWDDRPKIEDPDDFKPDDWNEDAVKEIPDMKAVKPADWLEDEEKTIPNPDAVKPEDWDDEMDGEWEPPRIPNPKCEKSSGCGPWTRPMIDNPEYKGKWKPALIDNPNYKGVWKPKRIPNPDYYEDKTPYYMMPIGAVGLELWSMSDGILFDNIIITDEVGVAEQFSQDSFDLKKEKADAETDSVVTRIIRYTNKKPWLWAVYLLLLAVPLVLFITFCCGTSNQEKKLIGEKKKRDEPEADDIIQEENEPQPEEQDDEANRIENEDDQSENIDENQDGSGDDQDEHIDENQDGSGDDQDEQALENDEDEEVKPAVRTSPRRRKPRVE